MLPVTTAIASESVVLDASVAISWLLEDQPEDVLVALTPLRLARAIVPSLWHLEVRNALLKASCKGRLRFSDIPRCLDDLDGLRITTDPLPDLASALDLAGQHGLSYYDAVYLELAKRRSTTLATCDTRLARAAISEGVTVVPDPD